MAVVGGILATVLGVVLGSILTGRSQKSTWIRDRQLEAYAAIIREGTRAQLVLREHFKGHINRVDWAPWNEALATISLVGSQELVHSALEMDAALWQASNAVCHTKITEAEWDELREPLEMTRLAFVNAARRTLVRDVSVVERLVARPSLEGLQGKTGERAEAKSAG